MLYLDSSALVKRYFHEVGSNAVTLRFEQRETIYTSILSYAEVHAAIGRKHRDKELNIEDKAKIAGAFLNDWLFSLAVLELTTHTMSVLPTLCEQYFLKASDAVHLAAAFWLRDTIRLRGRGRVRTDDFVEFGASDRRLGEAALRCGFQVFNPEEVRD